MTRTVGWGMVGAATTVIARALTRKMMLHARTDARRLPRRASRNAGFGTMLMLAAATGALLAIGDVLQEQRRRITDRA